MLYPQGPVGQQRIEGFGIGQAHHALVITGAAQPAGTGALQCGGKACRVGNLRRAAHHRTGLRRQRVEVDVMIVQAGH